MTGQVAIYIVEGGFLLGMLGFMWKISYDHSKGITTIFRRFDEYKESVKKDHVNKDVCKILHETLDRDVKEIKADVKTLIRMK